MTLPERAISLTGPWWWLMLHLPEPWRKCVENRSPKFSGKNFRGPIWVHAAKSGDRHYYHRAIQFAVHAGVPTELIDRCPGFDEMPRGGVVGRFTITGMLSPPEQVTLDTSDGAQRVNRWRMPGCIGLVTTEAQAVPFTPCAGALGIWRVPAAVLEQLARVAT